MDLLQEHFARVARAINAGENIRRGAFFDAASLLLPDHQRNESIEPCFPFPPGENRLVTQFARWAADYRVFDRLVLFASNPRQAAHYLAQAGIEVEKFGVEEIEDKARVYRRARYSITTEDIQDSLIRHLRSRSRSLRNTAITVESGAQSNLATQSEIFRYLSWPPHKLELVIDEAITPEQKELVISHWNPKDDDVQAFFEALLSSPPKAKYETLFTPASPWPRDVSPFKT